MARLSGNAIAQAGKTGQAFICGMNFYVSIPANIQAGTQTCAVDQQGFFVVSILNTYVTNGVTIPTREILTGPGVIDASNVERLIAGVLVGAR